MIKNNKTKMGKLFKILTIIISIPLYAGACFVPLFRGSFYICFPFVRLLQRMHNQLNPKHAIAQKMYFFGVDDQPFEPSPWQTIGQWINFLAAGPVAHRANVAIVALIKIRGVLKQIYVVLQVIFYTYAICTMILFYGLLISILQHYVFAM